MIALLSAASKSRKTAKRICRLMFAYFLLCLSGGLFTGSIALSADAAHTFGCVGGLAIALFADWLQRFNLQPIRFFCYALAAIVVVHSATLLLTGIGILYLAYERVSHAQDVPVLSVLLIAIIGCVIKVICIVEVSRTPWSAQLRKATLGTASGLVTSVSVAVAATAVAPLNFDREHLDSTVGMVGVLFLIPRIWQVMNQTVDVLLGSSIRIEVAVRDLPFNPAVRQSLFEYERFESRGKDPQ